MAVVGACLGSFVATAAIRASRGKQTLLGRSQCDHCGAAVSYSRSIPIASFLIARGRCRRCGGAIARVHLAGEIAGASLVPLAFAVTSPLRAVLIAGLGLTLFGLSTVDVKTMRVPDGLTLAVGGQALCLALLRGREAALAAVFCAVVAVATLEGLRRAYLNLRGEPGLGLGDVKLVGALALWLGLSTPVAVGIAALLGLAAAWRLKLGAGRLPFAPFLAAAAFGTGIVVEAVARAAP